jgi:hypothetical protein
VRLNKGTCKHFVIGALPTYLKMITIETWVTNAVVGMIEDALLFGGQSAYSQRGTTWTSSETVYSFPKYFFELFQK